MTALHPQPTAELRRIVVLAESDAETRLMYRAALHGLPLDIVEVADGRDAMVQCLIARPALVIADTHLPKVNGLELCRILRADRDTRTVPILVITADGRAGELTQLRQLGATAVMQKPIAIDSFAAKVAELSAGTAASETEPDEEPTAASAGPSAADVTPRAASKTYRRFETTTPPVPPPALRCRSCDVALGYRKSRIGGVTRHEPEQWDEFRCPRCAGAFEYRHRTRSLRALA